MPAQAYYKSSETREWRDIVGLDVDYRRYQNGTFLPDGLQGLFMGPVKTRQLRQGYYASISYVDWCVGELLREAKKVDGYDDAVVVFMSDHGYQVRARAEASVRVRARVRVRVRVRARASDRARASSTLTLSLTLTLSSSVSSGCGIRRPTSRWRRTRPS